MAEPPRPGAVEEFWKTFSSRTTLVPRRAKPKNLPVELLVTIFKLVHEQEKEAIDLRWSTPDMLSISSSLFPYAIAAVCSLWKDAMTVIPEFWTHLVIVVDSTPSILPSAVQSVLSWSRDLPLNVAVTRRNFNLDSADSHYERTQVVSIMNTLINPHLHRIQKLYFDVMFSSSLPPFHNGFHGTADILQELRLECREDNGSSADDWETDTSTEQQFSALEKLFIDGRSYFNACRGDSRFATECAGLWCLAISNYKPLPGESFLVSDFLRPIAMIEDLQYLNMANLILGPSPNPLPTSTIRPFIAELRLKDVHDPRSLAEILNIFTNTTDITLTHSATGDVGPFNSEGYLTLENIDADQDLVPLLHSWQGSFLTINGCPSFNDTTLSMMFPPEDGPSHCARFMTELAIVDCPNFSVLVLRQLVSVRLDYEFAIQSLRVSGRAPVIAGEDYRWLSENTTLDYTRTVV